MAWLASQPVDGLCTTGSLPGGNAGIARTPTGRRRKELQTEADVMFNEDFERIQ